MNQYGKAPATKTHDSILDFVGNTPLIRLNRIPKEHGIACDIYAKCEFLNPSGSIKDRIALSMLRDAQKSGIVHEDSTLIEPTSGNTGIGIAFNSALLNKKCIIVTEVKNSDEKVNTLRLLGAQVIQVKIDEDEIAIAHKLRDEGKNMVMLNQFDNLINPKTHYDTTGQEILTALGPVDMVVMGAGTGGTITGIGRKFKEFCPKCKVVVAEPHGSTLFNEKGKNHQFLVEGIGGSWAPLVLDRTVVDHMEVVTDEESFLMARDMSRKEGLLCGGSSGTAMVAAITAIKRLNIGAGQRVVVILPDGIRNYMTKFVSDQWMEAHLFMDPPQHRMVWWNQPITSLALRNHSYPIIQNDYTCEKALSVMKDNIAIVVDNRGAKCKVVVAEPHGSTLFNEKGKTHPFCRFVGAISKDTLRKSATNPTKLPGEECEIFNFKDLVTDHLFMHVFTLAKNGKKGMPTVGRLSRMLDITPFVVIGYNEKDADRDYFIPEGVATGDDVLDYIFANRHLDCGCN